MLPELFRIPFLDLPVHTYGALYVCALMVGLLVAYKVGLRQKKYYDDMLDYGFWALVGALLGARVLFIMVEAQYYFVEQPFTEIPKIGISIPTIFALWKGGFVFWGGAIGGLVALVLFCKKRGIVISQFVDLATLGLPIGHAVGRIGCIAGGCCYGYESYHLDHAGSVVANVPFAMSFPPGSIAYGSLYANATGKTLELMQKLGTTVPLFPVQLVESLGNAFIFLILLFLTPYKRAHGQIALAYMVLYSIMRSFTETLRGDAARGFVIENVLSTSQFISLMASIVAIVAAIFLAKKSKKNMALV